MPVTQAETSSGSADFDGLSHFYCCDVKVGLCGSDLTDCKDVEDVSVEPNLCIVCDLSNKCPRCGAEYA